MTNNETKQKVKQDNMTMINSHHESRDEAMMVWLVQQWCHLANTKIIGEN